MKGKITEDVTTEVDMGMETVGIDKEDTRVVVMIVREIAEIVRYELINSPVADRWITE